VREILTSYGPIALVWFDTPRMMNVGDRAQRFVELVRSLQPQCLVDGRLGTTGDYRSMGDNRIPNTVVNEDWEVPATLNRTWGYKKDDTDWKPPADLVFKLADPARKPLPVKAAGDTVVVTLPPAPVGEYATVLCLEIKGADPLK